MRIYAAALLAMLIALPVAHARDDLCEPCRSESKRCLKPLQERLDACEVARAKACQAECPTSDAGTASADCLARCRAAANCRESIRADNDACEKAFWECAMRMMCHFDSR